MRSSVNTTQHTSYPIYVKTTMLEVSVLNQLWGLFTAVVCRVGLHSIVFSSICLVQLHIHLPDGVHLKMKSQSLSIHPHAEKASGL